MEQPKRKHCLSCNCRWREAQDQKVTGLFSQMCLFCSAELKLKQVLLRTRRKSRFMECCTAAFSEHSDVFKNIFRVANVSNDLNIYELG